MTTQRTASEQVIGEVTSWPGIEADHPVFPDMPGPAARSIHDEADIRDVIELLRLNYTRLVARFGLPIHA